MLPWETLAEATAPDGVPLQLRRRGTELLIRAGGRDLMSSEDEGSSKALAELALARLGRPAGRVLVGGLGMGYTVRAALDAVPESAAVEVAELVDAVVEWNRGVVGNVAQRPLDDPRTTVHVVDVARHIAAARDRFDAILLDVDNGPDALAHDSNEVIYAPNGLARAKTALRKGGVLAVWSFSDDPTFTRRCKRAGFATEVTRVPASRKGRGRYHYIWLAQA